MDSLRLLLAEKRARLAAASPGPDDTLVSLGLEQNPPKPITPEQEAALDAELINCNEYTVNGAVLLQTKEEHERMEKHADKRR